MWQLGPLLYITAVSLLKGNEHQSASFLLPPYRIVPLALQGHEERGLGALVRLSVLLGSRENRGDGLCPHDSSLSTLHTQTLPQCAFKNPDLNVLM